MTRLNRPRTRIERAGADRARSLRQRIAGDVRSARRDAGLSLRGLASGAGISHATLSALERGTHDPTTEVLARVGAALGMDLSVRFYPGTGPLIRDHIQAAMIEGLLDIAHPRWHPSLEVWVTRPLKGVIDLVLESVEAGEPLVTTEAQSELHRLEQQVRWAHAKSEALADVCGRSTSPLLLLRNTRHTRAVVAEHARTMQTAYPALAADAYAALTAIRPWPGAAIVWADVDGSRVRIRAAPPRSITVGR